MLIRSPFLWLVMVSLFCTGPLNAQDPLPAPTPVPGKAEPIKPPEVKLPPPPARDKVAVTVNNKNILEIAVYRALTRIPPEKWPLVRSEVVNFLVENSLVDQYLEQLKISVDPKEVDDEMKKIKEEIGKQKEEYSKFLDKMFLTEDELKEQIVGTIRWDKFMEKYGSQAVLKDLFEKNKNWFDGTLVRAKHILVKPKENTPASAEEAKAKVAAIKKGIDKSLNDHMAKIPAGTDKLKVEEERQKALDYLISETAKQHSDCPSKSNGGELGYFPRLGKMVEPFAAAAFGQGVYQMTEPVGTEFGYHLILTTDIKAGKAITYDEVKPFVFEVHAERLREAILQKMRPVSKITPAKAN